MIPRSGCRFSERSCSNLAPRFALEAAAHAGATQCGSRVYRSGGHGLDAWPHLTEIWFARTASGRQRHDLAGWVVDDRHRGGAQALDLVAQARGFLEIQVGGRLAHARLEIAD